MARGMLNSINNKHMLYKIFIQADSQNIDTCNNFKQKCLKSESNYKATLRKPIRAAKCMYYLRLFTLHKNDINKNLVLN